jgi:cell wall-associated NlpC family hydrolase
VEIPEPGDLAVMRIDARFPEMVQHVGVYIGGGRVLHTMKKRESHLIRVDDPYWSRKIEGYYRWAG